MQKKLRWRRNRRNLFSKFNGKNSGILLSFCRSCYIGTRIKNDARQFQNFHLNIDFMRVSVYNCNHVLGEPKKKFSPTVRIL